MSKGRGPTTFDKNIGLRIRARRMEIGLSQEELGARLEITFQQVQKYEKGVNRIAAERLYDIATALDISVGFLLTGEASNSSHELGPWLLELLTTPDGLRLAQHFHQIKDPDSRRSLANLAMKLAAVSQIEVATVKSADLLADMPRRKVRTAC